MNKKTRKKTIQDINRTVRQWRKALDGDSGDAEIEAGQDMAELLESIAQTLSKPKKDPRSPREQLADRIYSAITKSEVPWLTTVDGTGNIQSHIAADALLADGWRPPAEAAP